MREVVIQIPTYDAEQNIEIDVTINGKNRKLKYRIEIVEWEELDPSTSDKIKTIKRVLNERDRDWRLVQIGAPIGDSVPIMFRKRDA